MKQKKLDITFSNFIKNFKSKIGIGNDKLRIGVLYSGGVDSSVLLHLSIKYRYIYNMEINVLHICFNDVKDYEKILHHINGISENYGIELYTSFCDLKEMKTGIKLKARKAIKQLALNSNCDLVLTGHHANDQIETFLLRLLDRGSLYGLKGMDELSSYKENGKTIILGKPFIRVFKNELYNYASSNNITYFEDETNLDSSISKRNYIRNNIIPLIENKFNLMNILNTMDMIRDELENKTNSIKTNIDIYSGKWPINDFINLSVSNRLFVIKEYFSKVFGYNLNKNVIKHIREELNRDLTNIYINLNNGFIVLYRNGHIECTNVKQI